MIKTVVVALTAAIIVIVLALSARAQSPFLYVIPPVEYDRPYTGILLITVLDSTQEVQERCKLPTPRTACSEIWPHKCHIIIVKVEVLRAMGWDPFHVLRHEHGHCHGGWSNRHEGIRGISPKDDAQWLRKYDVRDLYRSDSAAFFHRN